MEQIVIDVLKPILEQWPVVAVLLAVGWYVWRGYTHCQEVLEAQLKWFQDNFVDRP